MSQPDWIFVEILNMLNTGSQLTIVKSVVESADSGIESADSIADSATNPLRKSVCGYGPLRSKEEFYYDTSRCPQQSYDKHRLFCK